MRVSKEARTRVERFVRIPRDSPYPMRLCLRRRPQEAHYRPGMTLGGSAVLLLTMLAMFYSQCPMIDQVRLARAREIGKGGVGVGASPPIRFPPGSARLRAPDAGRGAAADCGGVRHLGDVIRG